MRVGEGGPSMQGEMLFSSSAYFEIGGGGGGDRSKVAGGGSGLSELNMLELEE